MAVTVNDILAIASGSGVVARDSFTQSLVNFATGEDLSDKSLLAVLRAVFASQPRLTGPAAGLNATQRDQLFLHMRNRSPDGAGRAAVMMFAIACAGHPLEQAVLVFMEDLLRNASGQVGGIPFLRQALAMVGVTWKYSEALLQRIAEMLRATNGEIARHIAGLTFLGFKMTESVERRQPIFLQVVVPLLRHLAHAGAADAALALEQFIYSEHIKALERPDHHRDCFNAIAEPMRALGSMQAASLPPLGKIVATDRPRIAFFLHNGNRLAHVEVLLSFLSGLMRSPTPPIQPIVYLLSDAGYAELAATCQRMGVEVVASRLPSQASMTQRFAHCRQELSRLQAAAVVFVSVPQHLDYLSSLKLAPVSIWWSMKFALPNFPMLDGRAFYRLLFPGTVVIEGQRWFGGPLGLEFPAAPDPSVVDAVRAKYPKGPILGTVAREEKIREPAYLDAVTRVMERCPTATFLWTGRQQLPEITRFFEARGIGDRCHFIGWVDPGIYCRVFDLFLETFPLTGLMSGWAMEAGQAVVTAGPLGWLGTYLAGIYDGTITCPPADRALLDEIFAPVIDRIPAIWAKDADGFVDLAFALLQDDTLRRDFGLCCQRFMRAFLADGVGSAVSQAQYFAKVAGSPLIT